MRHAVAHSHVRWQVMAALSSLSFLTIVDRVCISASKNDMSRELGLSDVTFGWVFGVFALGCAVFQIPSGRLVDRYGPPMLLAAIVLLWSFLTVATGLAYGGVALIAIRVLFGLAEAGAYPAAGRARYNWLPPRGGFYHLKDYRVRGTNVGFSVEGAPLGTGDLDLSGVLHRVFAIAADPQVFIENWVPASGNHEADVEADRRWLEESLANLSRRLPYATKLPPAS